MLAEESKLVHPRGMDAKGQQHIRNRHAQLCELQGRGESSIDGPPRHELYRISEDPGETTDLAAEHPEIVHRMKKQYDAWFTDVTKRWSEQPPAGD